ncbi:hypothetical protein [Microbacterium sp. XT11]|uniref:hypothetical protein n=1 Tax=Microbacterium sp. XT11 TaxID=367477 RepID=UPI0008308AD5|nr:hypothetical protein [Microbacterium sp. XT11]
MTEVQLFYEDLLETGARFTNALINIEPDLLNLVGDDPGVDVPAGRHLLRTEMNARLDALHDATVAHRDAGTAVAGNVQRIVARYSELDAELSGTGTP